MNEAVKHYGWRTANAPHTGSYLQPVVLRELRALGAQRVLDLGCGNGALCAALAANAFDVVGVDADADGIAIAAATHRQVHFHRMSIDEDPQRLVASEGHFDVIVSTEVIEHLFSPHLLPRFAAALLRPGGALLITTPYHGYLKNLALSLTGKWDDHHTALWHGGHIKFFSRATLTRLLADNGFVVDAFRGIGRAPWLWKSMLVVARPAGPQLGQVGS